jgi:hypothetical protein
MLRLKAGSALTFRCSTRAGGDLLRAGCLWKVLREQKSVHAETFQGARRHVGGTVQVYGKLGLCLLELMVIVGLSGITSEEASHLQEPTAHLPHDDGTYVVTLGVFHQLHCVNHLRKALYPDEYPGLWEYSSDGTVKHDGLVALHRGWLNSFGFNRTDRSLRPLSRHTSADVDVSCGCDADAFLLPRIGRQRVF